MQENAVSILRVSTKRQLKGESIQNQRADIQRDCERRGQKLIKEFVLSETASDSAKRVTFKEALDWILKNRRQAKVVKIWKVDRFSRGGVHDYYQLKSMLAKFGIRLESATENIDDSPSGEMMEGMLAVSARFDNRVRMERTLSVEKILAAQGYWCRNAPTGFRNVKITVIDSDGPKKRPSLAPVDPKQWDLLCYGLRRQLSGVKPAILARELAEKGLLTSKGNPMSPQTWTKICRSPVYGGMNDEEWIGKLIVAKWKGPLTPAEWHALQRVLNKKNVKNSPKKRRRRLNPKFPLRKFLRCPACGAAARGSESRGKLGKKYGYYDCANKSCHFRVDPETTQRKFLKFIRKAKPTPELLELFNDVVLDAWRNKYAELNRENIELSEKVVALRKEKRDLIDLMKGAKGSPALLQGLQEEFERVDQELKAITNERNECEIEEYDAEAVVNYCSFYLKYADELWRKSRVEDQDRLQTLMFPSGIHYDSLDGKRTPEFSLVYKAMRDIETAPNEMAAPRGIEPRFAG